MYFCRGGQKTQIGKFTVSGSSKLTARHVMWIPMMIHGCHRCHESHRGSHDDFKPAWFLGIIMGSIHESSTMFCGIMMVPSSSWFPKTTIKIIINFTDNELLQVCYWPSTFYAINEYVVFCRIRGSIRYLFVNFWIFRVGVDTKGVIIKLPGNSRLERGN